MGGGPARRSTGRRTVARAACRSSIPPRELGEFLVGERANERREALVRALAVRVAPQERLDVIGGVLREQTQAPHLAAEPALGAEPAAEVDEERLAPRAVRPRLERAHQPDVRDLEPRARVRAAIHMAAHVLARPPAVRA